MCVTAFVPERDCQKPSFISLTVLGHWFDRYKLEVHTGNKFGGGTAADISATLYGDKGDTGAHQLRTSPDEFKNDAVDTFQLTSINAGPITRVKFDLSELSCMGAAWFLNKAIVTNSTTGLVGEFILNNWINKKTGWCAFINRSQSWIIPAEVLPDAPPSPAAEPEAEGEPSDTEVEPSPAEKTPEWLEVYTSYEGKTVRCFYNLHNESTTYEEPAEYISAEEYKQLTAEQPDVGQEHQDQEKLRDQPEIKAAPPADPTPLSMAQKLPVTYT